VELFSDVPVNTMTFSSNECRLASSGGWFSPLKDARALALPSFSCADLSLLTIFSDTDGPPPFVNRAIHHETASLRPNPLSETILGEVFFSLIYSRFFSVDTCPFRRNIPSDWRWMYTSATDSLTLFFFFPDPRSDKKADFIFPQSLFPPPYSAASFERKPHQPF